MTHSASEAITPDWYGLRVPTAITPLVALDRPEQPAFELVPTGEI